MLKVKFNKTQTICANEDQGGCLVIDNCLTYHLPKENGKTTFIKPINGYGFSVLNEVIQSIEHVKSSSL